MQRGVARRHVLVLGSLLVLVAEYRYDALNRRIVKIRPDPEHEGQYIRTDFYYNPSWQIAQTRENDNLDSKEPVATARKYEYIWDVRYIDAPVCRAVFAAFCRQRRGPDRRTCLGGMAMRVSIGSWVVFAIVLAGCGTRFKATPPPDARWSMSGGNPGRTWQGPDLPLEAAPELLWTKTVGPEGEVVTRSVADEKHLFVTSWREPDLCFITCIDLCNGQEMWRTPLTHRVGEIALRGKQLFVVGDEEATAVDCTDGHVIWQQRFEKKDVCGLVADSTRMYIVSKTAVTALDTGNGRTLWSIQPFPEPLYDYMPTFAMSPGVLLVGSMARSPELRLETRVYGFCPEDGTSLWQVRLPRVGIFKARALMDNGGMALTPNGAWLQAAARPVTGEDEYRRDYLMLYNLGTRRLVWIKQPLPWWDWYDCLAGTRQGIATDGARAFIHGDFQGGLRCFDLSTGSQLWTARLDKVTGEVSHPVVSGRTVLAVTGSGYLHGLKSTSGRRLWNVYLGRGIEEPESQVLVSGQYVVVCDQSTIWVFRPHGQ